jgi:MFS family permease
MDIDPTTLSHLRPLRLWLTSRFVANIAKQMLGVIVAWQVYELTHDPLALGIIGLMEALPYVACALWAGHLADHMERRSLILVSVLGLLACGVAFTALSAANILPLWAIYVIMGFTGVFSSFETASSAYLQALVPKEHYPQAIAWNLTLFQTATIGGPLMGGALMHHFNAVIAYGAVAVLLMAALVLTGFLHKIHPVVIETETSVIARVKSGLRFIRSQKLILGAMSLDLFAVLFGDAVALFPIFADMFGVGPIGLGILRAAPAVGSAALSMLHALRPVFDVRWKTMLKAVTVFGLSMICFALSKNFALSVILLAIGGVADGMSVIIRSSIYQARTPDHLRGRVSSVNGIFIRSSNEIGAFESGAVARLLGTVPSVVVGGMMTLASVALMRWKFPDLDES